MKMTPTKNICSLCNRLDVKFYDLKDSIIPPNHLYLEGHTNLRAVLEKILNRKGEDGKTTNEICHKCREALHGIYTFTHQYTESEKIFHQITDVTVRLKKLKTFSELTVFKVEFEAIAETDKDIDSLEYCSTVCDNLAISGVDVKMECHDNFEDRIDFNKATKDLNIGLLGGKYSNTADSRSIEQTKIDSVDSEDAEKLTIEDEIIKEEWAMQEGDIFEVNANHDVFDTEQTKFNCEMCDKPSHAGVEFQCDQCDAKCKTSSGLRESKMSHTTVTFTCNQCNKSFSKKHNLSQHLREVHTDAIFPCDHCDATYKTKRALNVHKRNISELFFNCNQCDARFKSWIGLRDHKKSHTGITFTCNLCDKSFSSKPNLSQHLRGVHTDLVFSCDHCNATYKTKAALNLHKKTVKTRDSSRYRKMTHTGGTFACNKCDTSFSNKFNWTQHLRRFHTDLVFFCDHCDATYISKQGLNAHKRIVNGIFFNCDQCDARFKYWRGLRNHKISHAGVTLACNKCDSSFSNKDNLTQHLGKVHRDVIFFCDCDATYKSKRA